VRGLIGIVLKEVLFVADELGWFDEDEPELFVDAREPFQDMIVADVDGISHRVAAIERHMGGSMLVQGGMKVCDCPVCDAWLKEDDPEDSCLHCIQSRCDPKREPCKDRVVEP